jgi:hypothetical protein
VPREIVVRDTYASLSHLVVDQPSPEPAYLLTYRDFLMFLKWGFSDVFK